MSDSLRFPPKEYPSPGEGTFEPAQIRARQVRPVSDPNPKSAFIPAFQSNNGYFLKAKNNPNLIH
ncbi:hypothetical protein [Gracilimonas sp. BCB1]|uniref:hypothetical protein n=1 Tax=Gracilimonas sp. BCB1 TaxID=3152362 RepID=UPI0032D97AE2